MWRQPLGTALSWIAHCWLPQAEDSVDEAACYLCGIVTDAVGWLNPVGLRLPDSEVVWTGV